MKNALLNLQSQLKIAAPKVEKVEENVNFGKGYIKIAKSGRKLTNLRKKLRK